MYNVVVVLFNPGDHVPVIPLVEVVGKADNVPPEQIGATAVNVGVVGDVITTFNVCVFAHGNKVAFGVNT